MVVNCFRSLYLWVDLQQDTLAVLPVHGCELLSFFVPLGWFTASFFQSMKVVRLWIAFVLCTFGLIYSYTLTYSSSVRVVNCFRSLYLWVDLQLVQQPPNYPWCCELLSFFVPLGWFTAHSLQNSMGQRVMNCNWKRKSRPLRAGISLFIKGLWFCQKSSNCCSTCGRGEESFPMKSSILPNCLSVMYRIPIFPFLGRIRFTLRMYTSALSLDGQCLR